MKRFVATLTFLAFCWLAVAGMSVFADGQSPQSDTVSSGVGKGDSKISPLLTESIRESLQTESLSSVQLRGEHASASGTAKDSEVTPESPSGPAHDLVRFDASGQVQVYISVESADDETLDQLRELGARIEVVNQEWNKVQAWVAPSALDELAALDAVREITAPDYGVTKAGSTTTEGDAIHRAHLVRAFSGLTGAGVKVGVISNGMDSWNTARRSGDLPDSIEIDPDRVGEGDEGTALLEIIHDLAPGAELAFSGPDTSLDFVQSVLWLANDAFDGEGADVIVDDLGYYEEPYFEDGPVALAAIDAVAGGAVFVSATGNSALRHYEADFVDGASGYHAFDGVNDTSLRVSTEGVAVLLQWNDQFGASSNDYDLYVCRPGFRPTKFNLRNDQCDGGTRSQDGDDDPFEEVIGIFSGEEEVDVYVRKFSGDAKRLEIFMFGGIIVEHAVPEGGIIGHPAAEGVIAVGAVGAHDPGHDDLESFSDWGPAFISFPTEETRNKPEVVAIDGVSVTGAGSFPSLFFGTSAAAPHVAGIAALLVEGQRKADPIMTKKDVADEVARILKDTAIDLGEQDSSGYSKEFGYGRADAFAAVDSLGQFGDTFTVDSTGDGADSDTTDGSCDDGNGACTLRAAIQEANAGNGGVLKFNISGSGTRTIQPASALPTISKPVFLDGYSQTGASATNLLIELDGTNAGDDSNGLRLTGRDSYVRGMVINRFNGNGIVLEGSGGQLIAGNRIGTDTAGSTDQGNAGAGVYISVSGPVVLRNNVISGNDSHGVSISGSGAEGTVIEDNFIGTNAAGNADLGNTGSGTHISDTQEVHSMADEIVVVQNIISGNDSHGISLTGGGATDTMVTENYIGTNRYGASLANSGSGVQIGGGASYNTVEANTIANNWGDGVTVVSNSAAGNIIRENSIRSNTGLGIDLGDDGVTANDATDTDSGPNNLQNFPTNLAVATRDDAAAARFTYYATAHTLYIVDFYASDSCDGSGNGEGQQWLGYTRARPSETGLLTFAFSTIGRSVISYNSPARNKITATVTNDDQGHTSEFSSCVDRKDLPELVLSEDSVSVTENSTTNTTYTVRLSSQPSTETKVKLSLDGDSVVTVSASELTFATTNGTTPQTVTVTAVSDDDPLDEATAILHSVSIGDHDFPTALLPVAVTDDDAPVLTLTRDGFPSATDVAEGYVYDGLVRMNEGDTATYTVELGEEPEGDTVISLNSSDSTVLNVSPSPITFTKRGEAQDADKWEWDDAQTVTLTPVSDSDASDELATVYHEFTADGKGYVLAQVRALITDLALPGLTFQQQSTDVDEITVGEGGTTTYTLKPKSAPSSDITIAPVITLRNEDNEVVISFADTISVAPPSLTFTVGANANWETPQTVMVTGLNDDDEFDDSAIIWHVASHGGENYVLGRIPVTVTDGNRAPYFEEGLDTTREVPENAGHGANVGGPVVATDLNNDSLTYSLDDPSGLFEIDSAGQITLKLEDPPNPDKSLDYETGPDYSMDVNVTDEDGLTDNIEVKVLVIDVNEPPEITGDDMPTFRENTTGRIGRYHASDPDGDSFAWSVSGTEASNFAIDSNGYLSFAVPPDFEAKSSYSVSIVAADEKNLSGLLDVFVTIVDVDEPPEITGDNALTFAENTATTTVLETYSANDPEGVNTTFTWSLGGPDGGDFEISNSGELTFKNVPDYDRPADSGGNNEYNVQMRAFDGSLTGSRDVTITVTNINESPTTPTGRAEITVPENTTGNLAGYSATDPDRDDTVMWGVSGTDASAFRVDSSGNLAFDGAPDYETPTDSGANNIYEVSVDAKDASFTSSFDVTVTVTPVDEPPVITGTTTFDNWQENDSSPIHTYNATDPEGDTNIVWSLGGTDRGDFTITDGVLKFSSTPDYEHTADSGGNNHYEVIVEATDSNNKKGTHHVDVIVKNVDEPPVLEGPDAVENFPENSSVSRQVAKYTATDPEGATVTLSLSPGDTGDFTLASNGVLTFNESPDYEEQSNYRVTVMVEAGTHTVDKSVTVYIQNIEEPGTVTLSSVQPQVGTLLEATLEDDDGPAATGWQTEWQWYRASSMIDGETSRFYTPNADDMGSYLRAVAMYDDGLGTSKTAVAVSANRVQPAPPQNFAPEFPSTENGQRSIRENTPVGSNVGAPVTATDANDDRLTYTMSGSDAFEIAESSGQVRTKGELDHEDQGQHFLTVTATDPVGLAASIPVIITVEDVDETPVVTGETSPEFEENAVGNVATYSATDPDNEGIAIELSGTDSEDFELSGGVLTFKEVPNFEEPADSNGDNRYQVTIEAREQGDGTGVGRLSVAVQVANVDEPGVVEVSVSEPRVGQQLTPTVVDPDEGVGSIGWKWERRDPVGDWTPIPGATSRSYTPTRDDNGKELRVTAIYRDKQGPGKTKTHEFPSPVALRPFFPADTATRSIEENTPVDTNVGARFTALHPDNVNLTYSLRGIDQRFFTIDTATGQLQTSSAALDYETLPNKVVVAEITAQDTNGMTATITVSITVTDECTSVGEPPCAPGRPSVSSASGTGLSVTWSTPRTPSGEDVTGYKVRFRLSGRNDPWIEEPVTGTDRSHIIVSLTKGTTYEVQVRASNDDGISYGEWSLSGTGRPGVAPPPPPPPDPDPPTTTTAATATTTSGGGGGGGGGFAAGPAAPALLPSASVSPRTLAFTAYAGGEDPPARLLVLWSPVSRPMSFDVSGSAPWLSVAPVSGSSAGPGNRLSLTVSVDASDLSQGSYRAQLLIAGTGFRNPPQRVNVSVTVVPAAFTGSRALEYDADDSLSIDLDEALEAVRDYFTGLISLEDVLKIVRLYFIG